MSDHAHAAETRTLDNYMRAASHFRSFLGNRSGQFAIMMALLSLPVLATMGLAIDYSYAVQVRSRLRAANDAAALYAAAEYKRNGAVPSEEKINAYLLTNFNAPSGDPLPVIKKIEVQGLVLTLDTDVVAPLFIMQVFGNANSDVAATSSVTLGQDTHLQIALALDATHSMTKPANVSPATIDPDGNLLPPGTTLVTRMDALKVAALRFNNTILNDANLAERSSIAIVPFARYVNVGLSNRNAPWMSVPADKGPTGESCYPVYEITGYGECYNYTWYYDGVPVSGNYCPPIYGTNVVDSWCTPTGEEVWAGCVGSRPQPMNVKQAYSGSKVPGLMNTWCNTEILPLTNDPVKVANHISSLWTSDYTYIPEGVMWGWRALTKEAPYESNDAAAAGKQLRKILILMTDGENQAMADLPDAPTHHVLSPDMDPGYLATELARANNLTSEACEGAKDDGLEVYVVSFGTEIGSSAKQMLKDCATDSTHFYDATDATKLVNAFDAIAYRVSATYLSN